MGTATVSVVVPTHDRRDRLMRALASVRGQQASPGLEIIVVADRCADGTVEAVAALTEQDSRLRLLVRDAGGAAAARNEGVKEATGEYLAFLDDDDEWLPSKLARQLVYLSTHPEVGVAGCHWTTEGEGGRVMTYRDPERVDAPALLWSNFVGGCSAVLIRRSAVPASELRFEPDLATCEDWDLWQRLARHTGVAVVPEVLLRYHVHGGPRLSDLLGDVEAGRPAFAKRHAGEMTAVCLGYHRARHGLAATHGLAGRGRLATRLARSCPPRSLWIAGNESIAARLGRLRGDPCLGHRRLLRIIPR
jgi:hypothetical protein